MSISRHQATGAYRRWEPPAFDAPAPPPPVEAPPAPEEVAPPVAAPPEPAPITAPAFDFTLPTAEEIEQMHEAARLEGLEAGRQEGLEAGRKEGYDAGYNQGYEAGQLQARTEAAQLKALIQSFDKALTQIDTEVAEDLAALAIEMARHMVRNTLATRPEAVAETVRTALAQMPQVQARIHLHPDDVGLVREFLGEQLEHGGHRLVEDDSVTRGGCHLHAGGSHLDASIETRWRRILDSIGHPGADEIGAVDEGDETP